MTETLNTLLSQETWLVLAALGLAALSVLGPCAYLLITGLDLREAVELLRAKKPCAVRFLKALAHAVLFLKLLLH